VHGDAGEDGVDPQQWHLGGSRPPGGTLIEQPRVSFHLCFLIQSKKKTVSMQQALRKKISDDYN
jgi:hypothetical protein